MKLFWIICFGFGINLTLLGQQVTMVIDHKEAQPGDNVCLSVKISGSLPMTAIQSGIGWDTNILDFTDLRDDSIQKGPSYNIAEEGIIRLFHAPYNETFDSLLFQLCFNVISNQSEYSAVEFLNISQTENIKLPIEVVSPEAETLSFTTQNGYILIGPSLDSPPIAKCIDNIEISLPGESTITAMQINADSFDEESSIESLQYSITLYNEPYYDNGDSRFGQQKQIVLNADNSCSCSVLELHVWDEANQHSSCNVFIQLEDPTNRCKPITCFTPLEIGVQEFETFQFDAIDLIAENNFRENQDVFVSIDDEEPIPTFEISLKDEGVIPFSVIDTFVGDTCRGIITVIPECLNDTCHNSIIFDKIEVIEKDTFSLRMQFNFIDTIGILDLPISWDPTMLQFLSLSISGADIYLNRDPAFEKGELDLEYNYQASNEAYPNLRTFGAIVNVDFSFVAIGGAIDGTLVRVANRFDQDYHVMDKNYMTLDYQRNSGIVKISKDAITHSLEPEMTKPIAIFPNPATDYISIILDNKDIGGTIEIYNILGETEYSNRIENNNTKISLDLLPTLGLKFLYVNSIYIGTFIAL